jgi:hypothetical protein
LDGSDCISFLGPKGHAIFDTDFQMPVSIMLDRGVEKDPIDRFTLKEKIKEKLKDQVKFISLKEICQDLLGRSIYATSMILGVAYQAGYLPFSNSNMKKAFKDSMVASEFENNWNAFNLGRKAHLLGDEKFRELYDPKEEINFKRIDNQLQDATLQNKIKIFEEKMDIDISYGLSGVGRFRINILKQRGTYRMVIRNIPDMIRSIQERSQNVASLTG